MTTLTVVPMSRPAPPAPRPSSAEGRVWVTVSVLALTVFTLLVAGWLEYVGWTILLQDDYPQGGVPLAEVWGSAFLGGVFRTGGAAFAAGLLPVLVLMAIPGRRPRSLTGPLALMGAVVAIVLCLMGLLTTLA